MQKSILESEPGAATMADAADDKIVLAPDGDRLMLQVWDTGLEEYAPITPYACSSLDIAQALQLIELLENGVAQLVRYAEQGRPAFEVIAATTVTVTE